jgi:hypothetical protein
MDDILKILVDSRQQTGADTPTASQDPMADLIGRLLGGGHSQGGQGPSLGDFMRLLEKFLGSGRQAPSTDPSPGTSTDPNPGTSTSDPIMDLLQPLVNKIAKKVHISPEIATMVVGFVLHKLLAHYPTSGRDSTQFNLDDMLQQMSSGSIDPQTLQSSGLVNELARTTGLDHETAARSLDATFGALGAHVQGSAGSVRGKAGRTSSVKSARGGKTMKRPG